MKLIWFSSFVPFKEAQDDCQDLGNQLITTVQNNVLQNVQPADGAVVQKMVEKSREEFNIAVQEQFQQIQITMNEIKNTVKTNKSMISFLVRKLVFKEPIDTVDTNAIYNRELGGGRQRPRTKKVHLKENQKTRKLKNKKKINLYKYFYLYFKGINDLKT